MVYFTHKEDTIMEDNLNRKSKRKQTLFTLLTIALAVAVTVVAVVLINTTHVCTTDCIL